MFAPAATTADRLPPQSREAEMGVIGAVLRDNSAIGRVIEALTANDFYFDAHQKVFRAVVSKHVADEPIDLVILHEVLKQRKQVEDVGGVEYLTDLWDAVPTSANAIYHAGIVKEKADARRAIHSLTEMLRDAADGCPAADLSPRADHLAEALKRSKDGSRRAPWPEPVAIGDLAGSADGVTWLLHGCLALGHLTLLSALMKCGKSTFVGHLLRAMQWGSPFIGRATRKCRTLIVTEESEAIWIGRRDALGLDNSLSVLSRPILAKPSLAEWVAFLDFVAHRAVALSCDLVVIDTLSRFAPWTSENDSAEVTATMAAIDRLTAAGLAVLAIHHVGKNDSTQGRAARGSTALAAAADVLLELRRFDADDRTDRRRVLSGLGRFDDIPDEIVVALAEDGSGYTAEGDRKAIEGRELAAVVGPVLPAVPPGLIFDEVIAALPAGAKKQRAAVTGVLHSGANRGEWKREGTGKKGHPFRFWRAEP